MKIFKIILTLSAMLACTVAYSAYGPPHTGTLEQTAGARWINFTDSNQNTTNPIIVAPYVTDTSINHTIPIHSSKSGWAGYWGKGPFSKTINLNDYLNNAYTPSEPCTKENHAGEGNPHNCGTQKYICLGAQTGATFWFFGNVPTTTLGIQIGSYKATVSCRSGSTLSISLILHGLKKATNGNWSASYITYSTAGSQSAAQPAVVTINYSETPPSGGYSLGNGIITIAATAANAEVPNAGGALDWFERMSQSVSSQDATITIGQSFTPNYLGGKGTGARQFSINGGPWQSTPFTPPAVGAYLFKIKHLGDDTYTDSNEAGFYTLTVAKKAQPPPKDPQAVHSQDAIVTLGQSFTPTYLGGLGTGAWQFRITDSTETILLADWQSTPFTPNAAGTYRFKVKRLGDDTHEDSLPSLDTYTLTVVKEDQSAVTSENATITIGDAFLPVFNGGEGSGAYQLNIMGSITDQPPNSYTGWISTPWDTATAIGADGSSPITPGIYRFAVRKLGDSSHYDSAQSAYYTVTVLPKIHIPPTVSGSRINMAGCIQPNYYTYAGDSIGIQISGHDEDNNIAQVEWYVTTPTGNTTTAICTATSNNDAEIVINRSLSLTSGAGTYTIIAQATDSRSETSGWVEIYSITVQDPTENIVITSRALPNPGFENWLQPSEQASMIYTIQKPRGPISP